MENQNNQIIEFIEQHQLGVLSTVSADGAPHGTPIYYAWFSEDQTIAFATPTKTQKKENIDHCNRVSLAITDEAKLITVKIEGIATETPNIAPKVLNQLAHKLGQSGGIVETLPLMKYTDQSKTGYTIKPTQIIFDRYDAESREQVILNPQDL